MLWRRDDLINCFSKNNDSGSHYRLKKASSFRISEREGLAFYFNPSCRTGIRTHPPAGAALESKAASGSSAHRG